MRALVAAARRPRAGLALIAALHLASLGLFIHGFLLTRVHLDQRSVWPGEGGRPPAPYDRVVLLLVDALRYDMAVADARYGCPPGQPCHQRQMPFLANLTAHQVGAGGGWGEELGARSRVGRRG